MIDGMTAQWQRDRAESQLTLGKLIEALEAMPTDVQVANLREPGSYRGYYSDLYFEIREGTRSAGELLADCRKCMGAVFQGYKGGDYGMGALTPLWVATYGRCGQKLIAVYEGGSIETEEDE